MHRKRGQNQGEKGQSLGYRLGVLTSLLGTLMTLTAPVQAGYVPPPNADAPTSRTTGGGRRGGCQGTGNIDLVALAPQVHAGQTMSTHPTLVWYAPADIRQPLEVELYQLESNNRWKRLKTFTLEEQSAGFMSFSWPETEPDLTVGQTYRWQVISTCVIGLPARDLVTTAEIEVIAPPADLETGEEIDSVTQAQQYAENGLWYDALAAVSDSSASLPEKTYRDELLLDLADLETASAGDTETYLSRQLRRIAAIR